jgi:hypothetical protein
MSQVISFKTSAPHSRAPATRAVLRNLISRAWKAFAAHVFVSYRPERHYMRGPGPKWHEKYGHHGIDVAHGN